MGLWYVVSRLRGSSTPDSAVIEISPDDEDDMFIMKVVGARSGRCLTTRTLKMQQEWFPEEAQLSFRSDDSNGNICSLLTHISRGGGAGAEEEEHNDESDEQCRVILASVRVSTYRLTPFLTGPLYKNAL